MTIERIDDKRLIIALSEEDVKELSIVFENLNLDDKLLKNFITQVISLAGEKTGFPIENRKMIIEFLKQNGGYVIFVTFLSSKIGHERKVYKIKKNLRPMAFVFNDVENLINAVRRVDKSILLNLKSSLVEYKDFYFLILFPKTILPKSLRFILSEYGNLYGSGFIRNAKLCERGYTIIQNNAIETIFKYFTG